MDKILLHDAKDKGRREKVKENSQVCNFQLASNTLDTSVKIYSYRVDSVHTDTYRVLSGLNRTKNKQIDTESGEGEGEPNEQQQQKEKTKKRKNVSTANTLDSLTNLNAKKLDMEYSVDPLFHKTSAAFDEVSTIIIVIYNLN